MATLQIENYGPWGIKEEAEEQKISTKNYLEDIEKKVPDLWDLRQWNKLENTPCKINFNNAPNYIRAYLKAWAYREVKRKRNNAISTYNKTLGVVRFFNYCEVELGYTDLENDWKRGWDIYALHLSKRVREKIINPQTKVTKDPNGKIEAKTAREQAFQILDFFSELKLHYPNIRMRITTMDAKKAFPSELSKYFSPSELFEFRDRFRALEYTGKSIAIPYSDLIDIMEEIEYWPDMHIKTVVLIATHTGLRINEILHLNIDCLEPTSEDEIKTASEFIKKQQGFAGVIPDWSRSYWVRGHGVLKSKKTLVWAEGTPILVSKVIYDAVRGLASHTNDLREESGSKKLFLRRNKEDKVELMGYKTLHHQLRKFIVECGLPHFTPHQFRATFATMLHDLNVPHALIRKYLNHVSEDITSGYINSAREQKIRTMNSAKKYGIAGNGSNAHKVATFNKEFEGILKSNEWKSVTHDSQLYMFEHLLERHKLGISWGDHGSCMLPSGEKCPNGMAGVKPCYLSDCDDYAPDPNEEPFFIGLINDRHDAKKTMDTMGIVPTNTDELDGEIEQLENILDMIKKTSKEQYGG